MVIAKEDSSAWLPCSESRKFCHAALRTPAPKQPGPARGQHC